MNTLIMVWVLLVIPRGTTPYSTPVQLGPYVDLESCRRVQDSKIWYEDTHNGSNYKTSCIQVNLAQEKK